ncbi:MAG TPA: MBL fold metallo-hydrolase [Anaerolineae bacterium]|nr:MBL fold metallo-hydrolase [Anaerolineae bacterium]
MKLVLLGSGGFLPTETAQTACYWLPEAGLLLDAGSGLYRLADYMQGAELDIYLSHAHADHTSGLDYVFASFFKWEVSRAAQPLSEETITGLVERAHAARAQTRVHADEATLQVVQSKYSHSPFQWHPLQAEETVGGNGQLTHFLMEGGTQGFRLDWPGHALAYITDTVGTPTAAYVEKIAGVDVLLHDCQGAERHAGLQRKIGHSHLTAVVQVAARAQVKRLVLIHQAPLKELDYQDELEQARQTFPAVEAGYDRMEIDF